MTDGGAQIAPDEAVGHHRRHATRLKSCRRRSSVATPRFHSCHGRRQPATTPPAGLQPAVVQLWHNGRLSVNGLIRFSSQVETVMPPECKPVIRTILRRTVSNQWRRAVTTMEPQPSYSPPSGSTISNISAVHVSGSGGSHGSLPTLFLNHRGRLCKEASNLQGRSTLQGRALRWKVCAVIDRSLDARDVSLSLQCSYQTAIPNRLLVRGVG
jgi:hypothetical protein